MWFPGSTTADVKPLLDLYPSDPAAGSPFDTGDANAFSPQYKRMAALTGDWFFNAPRRQLLDRFSSIKTVYNFRTFPLVFMGPTTADCVSVVSARANFAGVGYVSCTLASSSGAALSL